MGKASPGRELLLHLRLRKRRGALLETKPTGEISSHSALPGPALKLPKKVAVSEDGKHLIVTSEETKGAWFYELSPTPAFRSALEIGEATSEIDSLGDHALLLADKGLFYWIDLSSGKIANQWNSRTGLTPSGNKGEDVTFLPEKNLAFVSFQKDSKEGKHKGSRVVLLDLQTFTPQADLLLPREFPNLNIAQSKKEQGPNPEMIFLAPKSDTLILSLDLYGGIGFANLDAALHGDLKNVDYVSSAPDGAWGTAFPDRGLLFESGKKDFLLISNASNNGGIVLFDVAQRKVVQSFEAKAGAEPPILLPKSKKAVTVLSGKVKKRAKAGLEKTLSPGNDLLVFDLAPLANGGKAKLERISFEKPVVRVEAIDPENSDRLLLALGVDASEFVIYDLATRKELTHEPAKGPVNRIAVWRAK